MASSTPHIALFCDEAGKESDRFLAVGGLTVSADKVDYVRKQARSRFSSLGIGSEMKWNKTKKGTRDKYQEMVHFIFHLIANGHLKFHCLLVDFQRFDHELREDGNPQESLKRMYYQLILHRLCKKHLDCNLYAFPDKARELKGLEELKKGLNSDCRRKYKIDRDCVRAIEFRDSKKEIMLQLNDIILGGVCYQKNKRFEADDSGHPKANLAGYILGKSGLRKYDYDTPLSVQNFTIWNLKSQHLRGGAGS